MRSVVKKRTSCISQSTTEVKALVVLINLFQSNTTRIKSSVIHIALTSFLPARRYASAGLCDSDVSVCLSVCPSVRLSVCPPRAGIVPSRAKAGS